MSMSGFKELLQNANSSLLDLKVLLRGDKSLTPLQSARILSTRKAFQTSRGAIIEAIEELANASARMKSFDRPGGGIFIFDGGSAAKMEQPIDQLEATLGCRHEHMSQDALSVAELREEMVVYLESLTIEAIDQSALLCSEGHRPN